MPQSVPISRAAAQLTPGGTPGLARATADESFFFASPRHVLATHGSYHRLSEDSTLHDGLCDTVAELLRSVKRHGSVRPLVVGAIPYDASAPPCLHVPRSLWHAERTLHLDGDGLAMGRGSIGPRAVRPTPTPEVYCAAVRRALAMLEGEALRKVVLARALDIELDAPLPLRALERALAARNSAGYTFSVALPPTGAAIAGGTAQNQGRAARDRSGSGPPRTLLGATPELLVSRSGTRLVSNPLAGSRPRSQNPAEDKERAAALLRSEKDLREHALVVEAVVQSLAPFCKSLEVPRAPSLVQTPTLWHLSTRITGEVLTPAITSLHLARALHPTPAVCGTPRDAAQAAIRELEPFDRGFFAGMVGWCDESGDGEWSVALRCAEVCERAVRLYAGAGIVPGSDPESELAETTAKLRTMLDALEVPLGEEI